MNFMELGEDPNGQFIDFWKLEEFIGEKFISSLYSSEFYERRKIEIKEILLPVES